MVFNGVIGPTREESSDGRPLISVQSLSVNDRLVFLQRERSVLDLRGELIAPSEAAGLARTARNGLTNQGPVARAVFLNQSLKRFVLFGTPWALDPVELFSHGRSFKEEF